MKKVWFITGSSSGLGRCLTEAVLAKGDLVAATARNLRKLEDLSLKYPDQLFPVQLDVSDEHQILQAVDMVMEHFGRIDVLVNNAGFGITGATEAFTTEQVNDQFKVNLLAPIEICRAVLPHMRSRRSGRIFNISSIGGRVASIGLSIYQSAKFGLSGFSEALAKEVAPLGIAVTSVEPGGIQTEWGGTSMTFASQVEGYESTVDTRVDFFKSGKFVPKSDPAKVAEVIIQVTEDAAPPVHLLLGSDAVGIFNQADADRQLENKKWMTVSLSTDAQNQ
jgi:NAD(P)-dependent dehydrogenase (short-subunit alcohol dehydrogenase family)